MTDPISGIAPDPSRAVVGGPSNTDDVLVIRTMAEAAEVFGDPAGWPPEMLEAMAEAFAPSVGVPFVRVAQDHAPDLTRLPDAPEVGAPLYLSADGYTVLARDDKGAFHPVADVTERTPGGFVARLRRAAVRRPQDRARYGDAMSGPAPSSARCTCGSLIPCDAHETDDDRREAVRKIKEEMTARVLSAIADGTIPPCDALDAIAHNPGARVVRTGE